MTEHPNTDRMTAEQLATIERKLEATPMNEVVDCHCDLCDADMYDGGTRHQAEVELDEILAYDNMFTTCHALVAELRATQAEKTDAIHKCADLVEQRGEMSERHLARVAELKDKIEVVTAERDALKADRDTLHDIATGREINEVTFANAPKIIDQLRGEVDNWKRKAVEVAEQRDRWESIARENDTRTGVLEVTLADLQAAQTPGDEPEARKTAAHTLSAYNSDAIEDMRTQLAAVEKHVLYAHEMLAANTVTLNELSARVDELEQGQLQPLLKDAFRGPNKHTHEVGMIPAENYDWHMDRGWSDCAPDGYVLVCRQRQDSGEGCEECGGSRHVGVEPCPVCMEDE